MGFSKTYRLIFFLLLPLALFADTELKRCYIPYLMQNGEYKRALSQYKGYVHDLEQHDFELLEKSALAILEEGAKSGDKEKQILSLFGASIGGVITSFSILDAALNSPHPEIQMMALQYVGRLQDDRGDELLLKLMSSPYLQVRLEAAYFLAMKKHPNVVGHLQSLMMRIPPPYRSIFPQFFALAGNAEGTAILRSLLDDNDQNVRIESILHAAQYGRDDFLSSLRMQLTHPNHAEQESCAMAVGALRDSHSIKQLNHLAKSPHANVKLAALRSLWMLGMNDTLEGVIKLAKKKNPFAITLLASIEGGEDTLYQLMDDPDISIRINASLSLLKRHDKRSLKGIEEILLKDMRDLAFIPQFSPGKTIMRWKVIASAAEQQKNLPFDLYAVTLYFREMVLRECLELEPKLFLSLAKKLLHHRQNDLVPTLVALLENSPSEETYTLLEEQSQRAGYPFIRAYCNLALFSMRGSSIYQERLINWIEEGKALELVKLRAVLPRDPAIKENSTYTLTAEENSQLLIDSLLALNHKNASCSIDLILKIMEEGHPSNRYVLAGILLQAIH